MTIIKTSIEWHLEGQFGTTAITGEQRYRRCNASAGAGTCYGHVVGIDP